MIAQETKLNASKVRRTNFATGPVLATRSTISPLTKNAEYEKNGMRIWESALGPIIDDHRADSGWPHLKDKPLTTEAS